MLNGEATEAKIWTQYTPNVFASAEESESGTLPLPSEGRQVQLLG